MRSTTSHTMLLTFCPPPIRFAVFYSVHHIIFLNFTLVLMNIPPSRIITLILIIQYQSGPEVGFGVLIPRCQSYSKSNTTIPCELKYCTEHNTKVRIFWHPRVGSQTYELPVKKTKSLSSQLNLFP